MNRASLLAQEWLRQGFVLVDTETTGTGPEADIVQFAAIDHTGRVVLHSLIKPAASIDVEGGAFKVHGLDDAALEYAPTFQRIWPAIHQVLSNRLVIAYNCAFDKRMVEQCQAKWKHTVERPLHGHTWACAMLLYGEYIGQTKWQKLSAASERLGVVLDKAHDALYDCYAALGVIKAIAAAGISDEPQTLVEECLERFGGEVVSGPGVTG